MHTGKTKEEDFRFFVKNGEQKKKMVMDLVARQKECVHTLERVEERDILEEIEAAEFEQSLSDIEIVEATNKGKIHGKIAMDFEISASEYFEETFRRYEAKAKYREKIVFCTRRMNKISRFTRFRDVNEREIYVFTEKEYRENKCKNESMLVLLQKAIRHSNSGFPAERMFSITVNTKKHTSVYVLRETQKIEDLLRVAGERDGCVYRKAVYEGEAADPAGLLGKTFEEDDCVDLYE